VAEFLNKTEEGGLMKHLFVIATLAAFIGTATATPPPANCCPGSGKCCSTECCKK
jgi:hypothetical protein